MGMVKNIQEDDLLQKDVVRGEWAFLTRSQADVVCE